MFPGARASKDGLHIIPAEQRVDGYAVYHLYNGKEFVCAAYGGMAVLTLGLAADRLSGQQLKSKNGLDWLLLNKQ